MDFSSLPDIFIFLALLLPVGLLAGFLAGLLGIGGGTVLVPAQFYLYKYFGFSPDIIMHVSVATALAVTIPTALSSVYAHNKRGAVDFDLVKQLGGGVFMGVVIGIWIASHIDTRMMGIFFSSVTFLLVFVMFADMSRFSMRFASKRWQHPLAGKFMGTIASLMGIGGAIMSVPYMLWVNTPIHRAIATASALGIVVAIPAVVGYIFIGKDVANLPDFSWGYVYLPALISIVSASVFAAPFGAAAAHRLPVKMLKNIFAIFVLIVAVKMGFDLL
jgi:uncharacterized membrane protein YfcA